VKESDVWPGDQERICVRPPFAIAFREVAYTAGPTDRRRWQRVKLNEAIRPSRKHTIRKRGVGMAVEFEQRTETEVDEMLVSVVGGRDMLGNRSELRLRWQWHCCAIGRSSRSTWTLALAGGAAASGRQRAGLRHPRREALNRPVQIPVRLVCQECLPLRGAFGRRPSLRRGKIGADTRPEVTPWRASYHCGVRAN
jgi:hypothetical protein